MSQATSRVFVFRKEGGIIAETVWNEGIASNHCGERFILPSQYLLPGGGIPGHVALQLRLKITVLISYFQVAESQVMVGSSRYLS